MTPSSAPTSGTAPPMESRRNRTLFGVAAGVVGVVGVAVFLGAGPGDSRSEPLRPPSPTPSLASDVNGWPDTSRNPPGLYSLDGYRSCGRGRAGSSCNLGWMHSGYGSNDIDVWILGIDPLGTWMPKWAKAETGSGGDRSEAGTPVVVAGHDGIYRKVNDRRERWFVDIEGTAVAIQLLAKPGTSKADFAEAHAIIDSLSTEPSDHNLGFRLVFTLMTDDWDSG